jgi:hypothetical protein
MIKDKLTEAIEASLNNMKNGDDHVPLNMRGELEVIVKDRDGNVLSYEKGHNQVTNLAKMAIIHLLAGEVGVIDSNIYSVSGTGNLRAYSLDEPTEKGALIYSSFNPANHSATTNVDGTLVSGEQFFFSGESYVTENSTVLSQVNAKDVGGLPLKFNFPTKMLFGTGIEAYDETTMESAYQGSTLNVSTNIKNVLNGYTSSSNLSVSFFKYCDFDSAENVFTNWYSNSAYRCRTLQPVDTTAINSSPAKDTVSISGAIKNCLITSTDDSNKYSTSSKMATADYRGYGYPCFIYARRSTDNFYDKSEGNQEVHYEMNDALASTAYETELTYTVNMPTQPVSSQSVSSFYPYNGWILKQAGLFSDSRYRLRSEETDGSYPESKFIDGVNTSAEVSESTKTYRDSVGGQLLFTRNLSSPILKTPDNEVVFVWHIFITI